MSLRPADCPTQELPAAGGCTRCAALSGALAEARAALAEARAEAERARRRAELILRYVPEQLGIPAEPPLRYRLVDALNRELQRFPGVHRRLKRTLSRARAAAARVRGVAGGADGR
ncbi:MAG: hypothetical protein QM767_06670 [Anaeromyxobacter sp.]